MHGRLKVRTTEEQKEAKRLEQQKKLKIYRTITEQVFAKRAENIYDEEGLALTEKILERVPDFFTLWNYRRQILLTLKPDKNEEELQQLGVNELKLTEIALRENPKSYGAWHHRLWSMEFLPNPDWKRELKLCNMFLELDERNFHCWDYRRSITKKCSIDPADELLFTTSLIKKNFSNYSAWHYRSKLLPIVHPGSGKNLVEEDILLNEYELVQNAAFTDPNDQSPWFYHRWLLGRAVPNLEISSLSLLIKEQVVIVFLSCPIKACSENLKLFVDGLEAEVSWKPAGNEVNGSVLWYCELPSDMGMIREAAEISAQVRSSTQTSTLNCAVDGMDFCTAQAAKSSFSAEISAATKDVLQQELESCLQLYELEPENKWTLFTSVLLMRAIDSKAYDSTMSKHLEQLTAIDAMRAHYYQDLRSKFFIENYIENMDQPLQSLSLVGKGLTSLHHFEHFHLMKFVDLSSNQLHSVYPLCYLLCVEELVLDDNHLEECTDIYCLLRLKKLSLKNNHIKLIENIKPLLTCNLLEELSLEGNPVTEVSDYCSKVKALLGNIVLDGQKL